MERIAKFGKVSSSQFRKDAGDILGDKEEIWDHIMLPTRSTYGSAGYDFKAPFSFSLNPGESIVIPTGINCQMSYGWVLMCYPRSGLGFKYGARLANGTGIIDSDYYFSDNEGHIHCKLYNGGDKAFTIEKGQGFMQGVFLQFGITEDDDVDTVRNGGFGSTDNK